METGEKDRKVIIKAAAAAAAAGLCISCYMAYSANTSKQADVIYAVETSSETGPGEKPLIAVIHMGHGPAVPNTEEAASYETPETEDAGIQTSTTESAGNETIPESVSESSFVTGTMTKNGYQNGDLVGLDPAWTYADYSAIHTGYAVMYTASSNRKNKIVAVNAGHGTTGGESARTLCHPDGTAKLTGGSTAAGATYATAVSSGMTFRDGTPEAVVTLRMARILRDMLLENGYDVLMLRDDADVQLDNIARTVISNNTADIHIALHWDSDGLDSIKGVFYMSVPDGLKYMEPVASHWQDHEALGDCLIEGLRSEGIRIWGSNPLDTDLTQTSYSTIPSVDIELGNQCSDHSDDTLYLEGRGLLKGIDSFFGYGE